MVKAYDSGVRRDAAIRRADKPPGPARAWTPCWVISRRERGRVEVLTIRLSGGEALPIFSLEEEARSFLRSSAADGWELRETGAGELASLLLGPCGEVERVVLDPPPDETDAAMLGLLSVGREVFVESLLGRGRAWFEGRRFHRTGRRVR